MEIPKPIEWKDGKYIIALVPFSDGEGDLFIVHDLIAPNMGRTFIRIHAKRHEFYFLCRGVYGEARAYIPCDVEDEDGGVWWIFTREGVEQSIKENGVKGAIEEILNRVFDAINDYKNELIENITKEHDP
jgi:hypothetical protein